MSYADQAVKRAEKLMEGFEVNPSISEENKAIIHKYVQFMRARGLSKRTMQKNLYCFSIFLRNIDAKKGEKN